MIELGLVTFIQAGLAGSPPTPTVPGGYGDVLPMDTIAAATPAAWVYRTVHAMPDYTLDGNQTDWTEWYVQIDCHGMTKAAAITLRKAIADVMSGGYKGAFPDPDATFVHGIYEEQRPPSGFSDANRTYVESLEYRVIYQST
jgi:hypothetical protein